MSNHFPDFDALIFSDGEVFYNHQNADWPQGVGVYRFNMARIRVRVAMTAVRRMICVPPIY
jgi:hypothetical protein